jgi:tetratricopeptide (TPR) repeat protein
MNRPELAEKHRRMSADLPHGDWFGYRDPLQQEIRKAVGSVVPELESELKRLEATQDWARLADAAERLCAYRPGDLRTMANLSYYYRMQKNYREAHGVLDRASATWPNSPMLHARRAEVFLAENRLSETVQAADAALMHEAEPMVAFSAFTAKGRALFLLGRQNESDEQLRAALRLQPENTGCLYFLGETLAARGQRDEAARCFERCLELKPDFAAARNQLLKLKRKE